MNLKLNYGFLIPLLLSLVLLLGFLSYFLNTEYENEKQAIILESRDNAFVELFANIRGAGPVEWTRDSLGNELIVKLKKMGDSLSYSELNSSSDSSSMNGELKLLKTAKLLTVNKSSSEITAVFEKSRKTETPNFSGRIDSSIEGHLFTDTSFRIEVVAFDDGHSGMLGSSIHAPIVAPLEIWKRLVPQLLFSILLIISLGASFIMIGRSLRKERQLAGLRNDFMSNMTHELKTPVSTISVALEALSNFNAAENPQLRKEYIDISKAEVNRLSLLVDKALNISLFEQGEFVYHQQILDLNIEIQHVLSTLRIQLDQQKVVIDLTIDGHLFQVNGDKTHMTNMIHNLIENAIKYSEDLPCIDIGLQELDNFIIMTITDHGKGIESKYHNKIFDKFFRVPQGDIHNVKGHGLGLSYVKEVVHNHGGEISIMSELGKGSTFKIQFPKAES